MKKLRQLIFPPVVADGLRPVLRNWFRLFQQLNSGRDEMALVDEVARIITATLEIDQVYQRFALEMKKIVAFDLISINVVDQEAGTLVRKYDFGQPMPAPFRSDIWPLQGSHTQHVIETGQTLVRANIAADRRFTGDQDFLEAGLNSSIRTPLISKGRAIGTIGLFSKGTGAFGRRAQRVLERSASQIAPAIENALMYDQARESQEKQHQLARENEVLAKIGRIVSSSLDIDNVYDRLGQEILRLIPFDRMVISVLNKDGVTLSPTWVTGTDIPGQRASDITSLAGSLTGKVAFTRAAFIIESENELDLGQFPGLLPGFRAGLRSCLAVPLIDRDVVSGVLLLRSKEQQKYSQRHLKLADLIGNQIAGAIANAQRYEQTRQAEEAERQRSKELATLLEVSSILSQPGTFDQKVGQVMEQLRRIAEADLVVFRVLESGGLRMVAAVGSESQIPTLLPYDGSISGLAVSQRQTIVIDDFPNHPLAFPAGVEWGLQALVCVPVISRGSVLGVVTVRSLQAIATERINLLTAIVNGLGPLLENASLEEERQLTEERMKETAHLASIGALAAGVAHEINNPLTSVLGYSDMVLRNKLPKKYRGDLQTIYDQAKRAAKIVQNLVFFARRSGTDKQYLDVNSVIIRAMEMKSYDFKVNNIQATTIFSPELRQTMVDEHQLVQVILNLLTNAEQAISKARGKGHIDVRTASLEDGIQITIRDDGPGISPEHLPKIFDPFFTTKEIGHGTGLGLSISYGIVKSHGGDIWGESVEGQGATFHITLPVVLPEVITIPQIPRPAPNGGSTKHLLVVDDEPDIRDLLRKYLELERYTVDLAGDGNEAWRKLRTMPYDCILLDLKMPEMSGPDLYELLVDFSPSLAKKVVFITGDTGNPAALDFLSDTGNFFVTKPFRLDDLLEKVNDLWESQSMDNARGDVQTISFKS